MPGDLEICLKPIRLTLNTRQFKKSTLKENCRLSYGFYSQVYSSEVYSRTTSNILDGAFLEKQLTSISCQLTVFTKTLRLGCLAELLICLLSLCDAIYFMLWYFLKNSIFTKVIMSIVSATLPEMETLIKNPPFYGN